MYLGATDEMTKQATSKKGVWSKVLEHDIGSYGWSDPALSCSVCAERPRYLKWAEAQLQTQAQADVSVVRQEVKHHVMRPKQGDEEKCGLGQAPEEESENGK